MTLKEKHFEELTDAAARDVYERLESACAKRDGAADDCSLMLIMDYCRNEQLKGLLVKDIEARGLGREVKNYRQNYYKPNESITQLKNVIEQQRKLLNELKLTPSSRKVDETPVEDELSRF